MDVVNIADFARLLAEEAGKRGYRIIIEPTTTAPSEVPQKAISKPIEESKIQNRKPIRIPKTVPKKPSEEQRIKKLEEHSWAPVRTVAQILGCSTNCIYDRVKRGVIPSRKTGKGPMLVNVNVLNESQTWSRLPVKVECVETGKIYDSMHEASRAIGRSDNAVRQSISRGHKTGGYHFRKVES